ncbi:MAG: fused MFS/spermidine synthase [Sphingorhabdus sp.]
MDSAKRGGSHYLFLATILVGSFLLFLVQPMIARMALPRLGGAPAVWNSAMLVYQGLLLGGYAYAHRLSREAPRRQAMVHIALLLVAALWLPLGLASFNPPADGSPIFWVPWLLVASIGPLFFAVAAQAPLMQRWYGLVGNTGEPYALYAASNIGSFAGLIAYPLLVEPFMPMKAQNWLWTAIYAVLVLAIAACARLLWRTHGEAMPALAVATGGSPIGWKRRLYWIALAAIPSGLMLSTTSHLTTDLMAMPLVWVIPLGLYLLSFSIAFADNQRPAYWITKFAAPVMMITGAVVFLVWGKAAINGLTASLSLLFVVAVALHNEMYRTRPAPSELTGFYLMMSVGGVVGGFFCAIVAPLIFDWTWEHPILILLAAVMLPQTRFFSLGEEETLGQRGAAILMLVMGVIALAAGIYGGIEMPLEADTAKIVLLIVIMLFGIMVTGQRLAFALVIAALMFANGGWHNMEQTLDGVRMRSYFGTYTVNATESGRIRWLNHGTTMHGLQMMEEPTRPVSYYAPSSGVGIAMARASELYGPNASIGVVGLGTGTLACYHQPGQSLQFFEIDPLMIEIARTRKIFSFVERCAPDATVTLGDARLTLGEVPSGTFDILALDAFSSDSIPLHLLTKEAFAVYRHVLKADGLLLVHISNRYIDLNPVVAAEARAGRWAAALRNDSPPEAIIAKGARASQWIALSKDASKLAHLTGPVANKRGRYYQPDLWIKLDPPGKTRPWTDDYASVLPHLSLWKTLE